MKIPHKQLDGELLISGGRPGGQTLNGGTGASEVLTLGSTSHATKGLVRIAAGSSLEVASGDFRIGSKVVFEADQDFAIDLIPDTDNARSIGSAAKRISSLSFAGSLRGLIASGDTQPAIQIGPDPAVHILLGPGGTTAPDVRLRRTGAATITLDNNASPPSGVTVLPPSDGAGNIGSDSLQWGKICGGTIRCGSLLESLSRLRVAERVDNPAAIPDSAIVYAKEVGGTTHLFVLDSAGGVHQLTPPGAAACGWADDGAYVRLSDPADRVGIGTATPQEKLVLGGGSNFGTEMSAPSGVSATATSVAGATLAAGTYYYRVVALGGGGSTIASAAVSATVDGTTTNAVQVSWAAVAGATEYRVYGRDTGYGQYWTTAATSYTDTGTAGLLGTPPTVTTAQVNKLTATGSSWVLGGKVGVGTATPDYTLDVAGSIRASVGVAAGVNVETLAANKTLTPRADKMYQYLGAGGVDRVITLATTDANQGDRFIIRSTELPSSGRTLNIYQGADLLEVIHAQGIKEFLFDGTKWVSVGLGTGRAPDDHNVAIGCRANGYDRGTAVGREAQGGSFGASVGRQSAGYGLGAAVGAGASGFTYGAAVGANAKGCRRGAALGYAAGYSLDTTADRYNTLVGAYAGYRLTTGLGNLIFGYGAGYDTTYSPTTGSYNILLGYNAWTPAATTSNFLNVGGLIFGTGLTTAANTISTGNVGIRTTDPRSALHVLGSFGYAVATISAATTLDGTHAHVRVDAAAAAVTATLPDATTCTGRIYSVKKIDASANVVTIAAATGQTIDGAATWNLGTQYKCLAIISNGANWDIVALY